MATRRRWMSIWARDRAGRPGRNSRPVERNLLSAHPLRCRCKAAPKRNGDDIPSNAKALRQLNGYTVSENTAHETITMSKPPEKRAAQRIRDRIEFESLAIVLHRARRVSPTKETSSSKHHSQQRIDIEGPFAPEAGFKEVATPGDGVMAIERGECCAVAVPWRRHPDRANDSLPACPRITAEPW